MDYKSTAFLELLGYIFLSLAFHSIFLGFGFFAEIQSYADCTSFFTAAAIQEQKYIKEIDLIWNEDFSKWKKFQSI